MKSPSARALRGRLREAEQLHRHHGLAFPLEITHDEFTTDIAENQILRTACERMFGVPRVDAESQRMLRWLLREFTDVTPIGRADPIPGWQPTRLNSRYHAALGLAELVLRATSAEHAPGDVTVTGFLFDMPALFEEFVTVALREELEATYGGRIRRVPLLRTASHWRSAERHVSCYGPTTSAHQAEAPASTPRR